MTRRDGGDAGNPRRLALEAESLAELVLELRDEELRLRAALQRVIAVRTVALGCLGAKATAASNGRRKPGRRKRRGGK